MSPGNSAWDFAGKPEDRAEEEIDERAVGGDPARRNVRLQRDGADGEFPRATEPGGDTVAKAFVQDIREDAGEGGNRNQGEGVVFGWGRRRIHGECPIAGKGGGTLENVLSVSGFSRFFIWCLVLAY